MSLRIVCSVLASLACAVPELTLGAVPPMFLQTFPETIDAVSVQIQPSHEAQISYRSDGAWSPWQDVHEDDDVVGTGESELLMLPRGTDALRVIGVRSAQDIHPIRVDDAPMRVAVASTADLPGVSIISREAWGADASLLLASRTASMPADTGDAGRGDNGGSATSDQRTLDCLSAQQLFPHEFRVASIRATDARGQTYRWPLSYSSSVHLLVVHHTAIQRTGDTRSAAERVRALYAYHAENRGWGDIGYHYLIDEDGRIYQGRQGGNRVVGGHAYCHNIGTLGIALLGNFDTEQPTQAQVKALQRLLGSLADLERIDLSAPVTFHGKNFQSPVVGHRDLMSTACPGRILAAALPQIRGNVLERRFDGSVEFLAVETVPASPSVPSGAVQQGAVPRVMDGIGFLGRTTVSLVPGGMQRLSFSFTAGTGGAYAGKKVADVSLSSPEIVLMVDDGIRRVAVTKGILLPYDLPAGETLQFQLIVQAPLQSGTYSMTIGGLRFQLLVAGRRARTGTFVSPFSTNPALEVRPMIPTPPPLPLGVRGAERRARRRTQAPVGVSSTSSSASSAASSPVVGASKALRIRLSIDPEVSVFFPDGGRVADRSVPSGTTYSLLLRGGQCALDHRGVTVQQDQMIRMTSASSTPLAVRGVDGDDRAYHGTLECRVVDGALTLINELSMEQYLEGLAEEPDSQPYEKQRAFAIAARTYATYYLQPTQRKFPGKPYDGSDDPASFQAYHGVLYADRNPSWVRAVRSTASQVLTYRGNLIKPPYFSSDDGRTRSPEEIGWKNFPVSEILQSKDDPWCKGLPLRGHGVGMSGCGALGQAKEGKSAEQILQYYYPGVRVGE